MTVHTCPTPCPFPNEPSLFYYYICGCSCHYVEPPSNIQLYNSEDGEIVISIYSNDEVPVSLSCEWNTSIVPAVRMTQRGKHVSKQAQRYIKSQNYLRDRFLLALRDMGVLLRDEDDSELPLFPREATLQLRGQVCRRADTADSSNLMKAIEDAFQGVLWANDKIIKAPSIEHVITDHEEFRFHVVVIQPPKCRSYHLFKKEVDAVEER